MDFKINIFLPPPLPLALLILGLASRPLYDCHSMIVSQQDFAPPITYLAYVSVTMSKREGRSEIRTGSKSLVTPGKL